MVNNGLWHHASGSTPETIKLKQQPWQKWYLYEKFSSLRLFGHSCSQTCSRWWLSRCVDRSRNNACCVPDSTYMEYNINSHPFWINSTWNDGNQEVAYLRNWDLAQLGSPTIQTLMSPLRLMPSWVNLWTPPKSIIKIARLISWWPKTAGAMLSTSLLKKSGVSLISRIFFFSSS